MFIFELPTLNFTFVVEVSLILGTLYWYSTNSFDYWKKRRVNGNKPYPLVGTSLDRFLLKDNFAVLLQKIYNQFPKDGLVGEFFAKTPLLIVKDPEMIKDILVKDFHHFVDHGIGFNTKRDPLSQHLFLSTGDTWKSLRYKLTPTFTSSKIRRMFPLILECGNDFQAYLREVIDTGVEPEMKELMAKYTTDVIGSCAFGIKMNSIKDEDSLFRQMGRKIFKPSAITITKIGLSTYAPKLFEFFKLKVLPVELDNFFIGLVKSVMASRDHKPSSRGDFIDLLIELKTKGFVESEKINYTEGTLQGTATIEMTDELLTAQAFIFFGAGFETSSTATSFALRQLAFNQEVQKQLIAEIDRTLLKYGGQLTYDAFKEMKYLQMVFDETLRMHPPAGFLNRVCTSPYKIPNTDIKLDKGVLVNIPTYALHHDPKYFPEPEKFIPERFSDKEKLARNPYVYLPFGTGPRVCIGLRFAKLQSMVGLVSVLKNYTLHVNEKTKTKIKFSNTTALLLNNDGIYLTLRPRHKN